ncbi:MAG: PQQ-binding-like beta-propeller repeat protein [Verrucomicrobiae bacterium]|nr:PQQ-binding-like beta-propeller repeat protein [Verrucomicrobiae bacterium]
MMRSCWNFIRVLTLLGAVSVAPVAIWWLFRVEHFARYWGALLLPFVGIGLLALWYLLLGWGEAEVRWRRFWKFGVAVLVIGVTLKFLTKYDGSTGGTSLPRFVWRWEAGEAQSIAEELPPVDPDAKPKPLVDASVEGVVDSPQFYGPNRDAMWPEASLVASFDWSEKPEELWRVPVGLGWSGFAVVGRRAITQEQRGPEEWVTCYDLISGDLLWTHRDTAHYYESAEAGGREMAGDGPRSVPTIHGEHVFTYGATGILNCLRLETGEAVWQRNVLQELGKGLPQWGKSTSPLVIPDLKLVVVSGGENSAPTLVSYETETGVPAWKSDGDGASYSSPRLINLCGMRQIVSVNARNVSGHDLSSGKELWSFPWPGSNPKVGQPIDLPGDRLLVTASYGAGSFLLQVKHEGTAWSVEPVWETNRLKTKFSSATVLDGHAFALDEGRLACVNLEDGSRVWKDGKYGFGQHLQVGNRLLIQAEEGYVAVVSATPEKFEEVARLDALNSMTWNPPTLAGRYLLVRNDREAICFRLPAKKS